MRSVITAPSERTRRSALALNSAGAAVVGLTLLALVLRASQIDQSLFGDEVFTYQDVVGRSFGAVLSTVHTGGENSPPLFFLLAWLSAKLGNPSIWIRLPSVVLGTATVPVIYLLGRETIGARGALIGTAIFAAAPFTVYYGTEARPYGCLMFFTALSTLALLRAIASRRLSWWWLVYVLSTDAAAYSHYTSVFLLAVQGLWSLWACRDRIAVPLGANLLAGLLYLPWLPNLQGKALAVIGGLYPLGVGRVLTDVLRPIPGHPTVPLSAIPTIPGLVVVALGALIGLASLVYYRLVASPGRSRDAAGLERTTHLPLLAALTLATPVGLLLYSILDTDLWLPRGLSASIPAEALLLGALLASTRRLVIPLVTVVVAVLLFGTVRSFDTAYSRPPFRDMAAYLDRVASPRDPIVIISLVGQPAITVELRRRHHLVQNLAGLWAGVPPGGSAYAVLDDHIDRAIGLGTPEHRGFELVGRRSYVGGGFATQILTYRRR